MMSAEILTYEEFLKLKVKYHNIKCIVFDCTEEGLYEGGDVRCYCPMCDKHADMELQYRFYLEDFGVKITKSLSVLDAYLEAKTRQNNLENKLIKALEEENG